MNSPCPRCDEGGRSRDLNSSVEPPPMSVQPKYNQFKCGLAGVLKTCIQGCPLACTYTHMYTLMYTYAYISIIFGVGCCCLLVKRGFLCVALVGLELAI